MLRKIVASCQLPVVSFLARHSRASQVQRAGALVTRLHRESRKTLRWLWIPAFAGMTVFGSAHAADQTATLKRVESYLNSITTMTAKFNQIDPEGGLTSGKMFLKRPGKMRWQYNPPTPVLMVSSGDVLTYYDYELDQLNQIPLDDSLAGFLARPKIKLTDKSLKISNVTAQANAIRLTITQVNKPDEGKLTLEFSDNPLKINNFIIADANGRSTSVQLQNTRFGDPIADELFVFDNPRKNRARRYRK